MVSLGDLNPTDAIGRVPCWNLRFFEEADGPKRGGKILDVNHRSHTADISVSLQGGLTPGQLSITLGRLTSKDFETLALAQTSAEEEGSQRRVKRARQLYVGVQIYWKSAFAETLDFDEMETIEYFRITEMTREVSGLDVVTKIKGQRELFDRLNSLNYPEENEGEPATSTLAMVQQLLERVGLTPGDDFEVYGLDQDAALPNPQRVAPRAKVMQSLAEYKNQMIRRPPHRRGRAMYLIRDGKLHIGPYRPIPHKGGDPEPIDASKGLIKIVQNGTSNALDPSECAAAETVASRKNYKLTCAGRRDLKPGDVLSFKAPSESEGMFGGFGLPSVPDFLGGDDTDVVLYVASISHKFNTTDGWLTEVTGVEVIGTPVDEKAWDVVQAHRGQVPEEDECATPGTSPERVSQSVGRRINQAFASNPTSTIAEIRDHAVSTTGTDFVEDAAQTSTVLRGFVDLGGPHQARLDDIDRAGADIDNNVPYATSFAWGPFGHVLPRYPGMRVMLLNNKSNRHDPVDIGALWKTNSDSETAAPAYGQAGDWWLILPSFADGAPLAAEGTDAVTIPEETKSTHDLITARGDRVIEVAGLTIRAFKQEDLFDPLGRPLQDAEDGEIVITQGASGATIKIAADGAVEVSAAKSLTVTTDEDITFTTGQKFKVSAENIELEASGNVDVKKAS